MGEVSSSLFFNFFIYLFIPFLLGVLAKKLKISTLIGYIIGGIILSNFFDGLISKEIINNFAYLGIVLLLFTIGLEIQFERMLAIKKYIVLGGILQITFSIIGITMVSLLFRFSFLQAALIGIAFSSSSTSLVAKIIQDRGEENSFLGEMALGILMFQDLAFIPFMIVFTSVTSNVTSVWDIGMNVVKGLVISTVILWSAYFFGRKLVPIVFNRIASISRELLNLFIILFIFFVDFISTLVGIPILVSIFLAGILISQTLAHYHIFTQIRPLRDLLAIMFFIYIGTNIKLDQVLPMLPQILIFTILIVLIKTIILIGIFIYFRLNSRLTFFLSLFLFQIDEDAFILSSLAFKNGMFSQEQYLFIVSVVLISLIITPFLINNKEALYGLLRRFMSRYMKSLDSFVTHQIDRSRSPIDVLEISNHVIICGYGRVGSYVGRAMMLAGVPFIAVDYNFHTVKKAKKEGVNIIYGDPTDLDILDYAELEKAVILILALPDRASQEAIILNAKKLNPKIIILTRVHREVDQSRMKDLGVEVVVQPEFEASLSIVRRVLLWKGLSREDIANKIKRLKIEHGVL